MTSHPSHLRHPWERRLLWLSVLLTLVSFAVALALTLFKDASYQWIESQMVSAYVGNHPEQAQLDRQQLLKALPQEDQDDLQTLKALQTWQVLLAPLALLAYVTLSIGRLYGGARANGVRIGPHQFPEVHRMWCSMASELNLPETPELFVINGQGSLNAYATCIPGFRSFGVIYSDILERTLAQRDRRSLRFILGHELGHIRLNHLRWWRLLFTALVNIPPLNYLIGLPLSRASEYSADQVGAQLSGDQQGTALMMLAAGKHLYLQVNASVHHATQISQASTWDAVANVGSDHPNLNWRIGALRCQCHGPLLWAKPWPASVLHETPATPPTAD